MMLQQGPLISWHGVFQVWSDQLNQLAANDLSAADACGRVMARRKSIAQVRPGPEIEPDAGGLAD